jgi:dUTP pyrophosphatase
MHDDLSAQHAATPTQDAGMAHESGMAPVDIAFVRAGARELYAQGHDDFLAPATSHSAGMDLRACLEGPEAVIPAGGRLKVCTGISVQPRAAGIAGFVYSRSGLGARDGITVAQGVGIIDPDYTGEILVFLLNTSGHERRIQNGERVAQLIFQPYVRPRWREVSELSATERGSGGFGHTGR